jgi:Sec-independent protein translocase protein TatA
MSDLKSKLPDFKELGDITGKLFKDIKNSVSEIINDYKQKHAKAEKSEAKKEKTTTTTTAKKTTAKPKAAPKSKTKK